MNSIGTNGESSVQKAASGRAGAGSRSPNARLPTWSWFWSKTTKRSGGRSPAGGDGPTVGSGLESEDGVVGVGRRPAGAEAGVQPGRARGHPPAPRLPPAVAEVVGRPHGVSYFSVKYGPKASSACTPDAPTW